MNRLFGTAPKAKPVSLNDTMDTTRQRIDRKNVDIAQKEGEIRALMEKMKNMSERAKVPYRQRALKLLKKKKELEQQRDQIENQLGTMERLGDDQETALNVQEQVKVLKTTAKALKTQHKKIDIDKIERMQEEMADLMEDSRDIQEALSRSYDVTDNIDEEDLEAELDAFKDDLDEAELNPSLLEREPPSFIDEAPLPELTPAAKEDSLTKETTAL